MNKINWVQKLSSRKFWLSIVAFITPLMVAFKVDAETIEVVVGIVMSGAGLIAYVLAEGWVDANREIYIEPETPEEFKIGFKSKNE